MYRTRNTILINGEAYSLVSGTVLWGPAFSMPMKHRALGCDPKANCRFPATAPGGLALSRVCFCQSTLHFGIVHQAPNLFKALRESIPDEPGK